MIQHPITCFLIEDDIDDQEIFCMALQDIDQSIHPVVCNDGIEALERLRNDQSFHPDYIFIDMNMPKISGVKCLEDLRKISRFRDTSVIMYSTYANPMSIAQTKQLGAANFIIKPDSISTLTKILRGILKRESIHDGEPEAL